MKSMLPESRGNTVIYLIIPPAGGPKNSATAASLAAESTAGAVPPRLAQSTASARQGSFQSPAS